LSELLRAAAAKKVIRPWDKNSEKNRPRFGAAKGKRNGPEKNLEFRLGNLQNRRIDANSVDLVILSQGPWHHAEIPADGDCCCA